MAATEKNTSPFPKLLRKTLSLGQLTAAAVAIVKPVSLWRHFSMTRISPVEAQALFTFGQRVALGNSLLLNGNDLMNPNDLPQDHPMADLFFAGVPIMSRSGGSLGALCVFGNETNRLGARELAELGKISEDVSRWVRRDFRQGARTRTHNFPPAFLEASRLAEVARASAGIGHEINGPLGIARSLLELAIQDLTQRDVQPRRTCERIGHAIEKLDRINKIVTGLTQMSRKGNTDPMERVCLAALVKEAFAICHSRFSQAGIEISLDFPLNEESIECRRVQISQVILNLLNNAFDALADSTVKRIEVSGMFTPNSASISVKDSGKGVPKAIEQKLMNPFFTTKGPKKGTGLGLYLSRRIVEGHHGALLLTGNSFATTFTILLPRSQPQSRQVKI